MTLNDATLALVLTGVVLFIWHCPIFKPYFGFRRPNAPR